MSVHVMTRVWEASKRVGSELLMLLAIADFADNEEGWAYPSVTTLANKCRMSTRNANLILSALRKSGELEVRPNQGPRGTNRYRVTVGLRVNPLKPTSPLTPEAGFTPEAPFTLKLTSPTPEAGFLKPLKPASDEPSSNHQESPIKRGALPALKTKKTREETVPGLTFAEWIDQIGARGEKAIPAGDPVFDYAEQIRLDPDMLAVQFDHFKHTYTERGSAKKPDDWRAAFRNSVRGNWFSLWAFDHAGAPPKWTSKGLQALASYRAAPTRSSGGDSPEPSPKPSDRIASQDHGACPMEPRP